MNTDFFIKPVQAIMTWKVWWSLLIGGVIGGVSNTVLQFLGMAGAGAIGMNVPKLNLNALGIMCLISAVTHAALFLKKSPLPNVTNGDDNTNQKPL